MVPFPLLFFVLCLESSKALPCREFGICAVSVHGILWLWQENYNPSMLRIYKFRILAPSKTMVRTVAAKYSKTLQSYTVLGEVEKLISNPLRKKLDWKLAPGKSWETALETSWKPWLEPWELSFQVSWIMNLAGNLGNPCPPLTGIGLSILRKQKLIPDSSGRSTHLEYQWFLLLGARWAKAPPSGEWRFGWPVPGKTTDVWQQRCRIQLTQPAMVGTAWTKK